MAVLKLVVVSLLSDRKSTAVLYAPVVRLKSAFCPSAVLAPDSHHPAQGSRAHYRQRRDAAEQNQHRFEYNTSSFHILFLSPLDFEESSYGLLRTVRGADLPSSS